MATFVVKNIAYTGQAPFIDVTTVWLPEYVANANPHDDIEAIADKLEADFNGKVAFDLGSWVDISPIPNGYGSCGYTAVGNTLVNSATGKVFATFDNHSEAVKAMLAIPPYKA